MAIKRDHYADGMYELAGLFYSVKVSLEINFRLKSKSIEMG
jgi:hypothetical protein